MLYVGNFSYNDQDEENANYCLMPAIVEAPDAETALDRFSDMLTKLHENSELLNGAQDVYLDSLVELEEAPEEGLVIQWQKIVRVNKELYSVLSALPGDEDIAEAYSLDDDQAEYDDAEDDEANADALDDEEPEDQEEVPEEAFISFE